ncbi:hypothetical protein CLOM_g15019 [Closterium sp. NIES-68]|nr:hypothetical protein CLOM_g21685 [Closterium sp. NIES-68]GJP39872.1 hypothetical protein CLOM_g24204 [Closterium sp. NIES-68]GJP47508.1 hypothetical protein CLOM_g6694 [Closterium sp. NIES-68]GJP55981.1 hypothetical protein CLOM_g15019 [Closterium sp. NIES-68]GJP60021.1 hypothetical protein CLOP_g17166 [Closterium sp. NIES-67]
MMTSAVTDGEPRQADVDEFRECLSRASRVAVLTGAGVSAASGVATFRGAGGLWRTYDAMELATPQAFAADPSVVWEFYHYRRCVVSRCSPNAGHVALVRLEHRCRDEGRAFTLITQNVDGLHAAAGSSALVELHGCLWRTRCLACGDVAENRTQPICAALDGKGAPDPSARGASIPLKDLPRCSKLPAAAASARACNGLLRPDVVWFGECLDPGVLQAVDDALTGCDLLLVVGTSGVVHPAAGFARAVRRAGGQVAEVNAEATPLSPLAQWRFLGDSATLLPLLLGG